MPVVVVRGSDVSDEFFALVERAAQVYFEELLPPFIDRYYRGKGLRFVTELARATEKRNARNWIARATPSSRARARASRVPESCEIKILARAPEDVDPRTLSAFVP